MKDVTGFAAHSIKKKRQNYFLPVFVGLLVCVVVGGSAVESEAGQKADSMRYWPQWRGPEGNGVAPLADPPVQWSEGENVRWKIALPGTGHATPIVWGERIYVTIAIQGEAVASAAVEEEPQGEGRRRRRGVQPDQTLKFALLAIDRKDGRIAWQRIVREEKPHEGHHPDAAWVSNSSVTDGQHIYAYFGSRGLYCFDMEGQLKWEKDLGDMQTRRGFGEGSSPALHGNTLVINWDHQGPSFIVALDKTTGAEKWRSGRDEETSRSTPFVVEHKGRPQIVTSATNKVRSYDLETGEIIWESQGMTVNVIPSPVASGDLIFVMSGFRGSALQAIRLPAAQGNIADSDAVVWSYSQDTPYVPSPLLYGDALYFLKGNKGILSCLNAQTGEVHYGPQRLADVANVYASPVGANGRVYLAGRDGNVLVFKGGPEFAVLATNSLEDGFDASPVAVDGELYLRGRQFLYCIAAN